MASSHQWSNIVVFFSSFMVAYGVLLFAGMSKPEHEMHHFACLLTTVGLVGVLAGMSKRKLLVRLQMLLLVYLTLITLKIVLNRLCKQKTECPHEATMLHARQKTMYLETMPGVYLELGTQMNYVVSVDPDVLKACEEKVQSLWVQCVFLLVSLLVSCLACSWRFIKAIDNELAPVFEYVALSSVDVSPGCEPVKEVPMPPPRGDTAPTAEHPHVVML